MAREANDANTINGTELNEMLRTLLSESPGKPGEIQIYEDDSKDSKLNDLENIFMLAVDLYLGMIRIKTNDYKTIESWKEDDKAATTEKEVTDSWKKLNSEIEPYVQSLGFKLYTKVFPFSEMDLLMDRYARCQLTLDGIKMHLNALNKDIRLGDCTKWKEEIRNCSEYNACELDADNPKCVSNDNHFKEKIKRNKLSDYYFTINLDEKKIVFQVYFDFL